MTTPRIKTWADNEILTNTDLNAEFDNTVNGINQITDSAITLFGLKQFNNTPRLITPQTNSISMNSLDLVTKGFVDAGNWAFQACGQPAYASPTTITIDRIKCIDNANSVYMSKNSVTTCDITILGDGGINQTSFNSPPTGTVTVTNATNTVTGSGTNFVTAFLVGDVIRTVSGQSRRITAITNNTSMTVSDNWTSTETGVTHSWGGRAPNTFYHLYAISRASDGVVSVILSTSTQGIALTNGYTYQRQLPLTIRTNASGDIIPFMVTNWFSGVPFIAYTNTDNPGASFLNHITNGSATSWTSLDCSNFVPKTSKYFRVNYLCLVGSGFNRIRYTGSTAATGIQIGPAGNTSGAVINVGGFIDIVSPNQTYEYITGGAASSGYTAGVTGYFVTEVQ